ncbi:MAG TPA: right-handed parallel beta-helix repeat-containing protein [Chthoniobacterales bacterium]|jgi:hypothetical protein|nr:right-handed parallel beta-helix repeat-containing protein [Chthoniobacterales bacterium]
MKKRFLRFRFGALFTIVGASLFLGSPVALAATFKVTNTADSGTGSLRAAIDNANALFGTDTIVFELRPDAVRVISLRSPLPNLTSNMWINNTGARVTIERSAFPLRGEGDFNIFSITPGNVVTLEGLTIRKGTAGGVSNYGATLTMRDCTVHQNSGSAGVTNSSASNASAELTLENCLFTENRIVREYVAPFATPGGGALQNVAGANWAATVTITNCVFRQNTSGAAQIIGCPGGAIANYSSGGKASVYMSGSTVENNTSEGIVGGGLYNATSAQTGVAELTLLDCTIRNNSRTGIHNYAYYTSNIGNTIVSLENCTLSGNQSGAGGAIVNSGMLSLTNCTLSQNSATATTSDTGGGAILNATGTTTVTNCTFSDNRLTGDARGQSVFNKAGATFSTGNALYRAVSPGVNFANAGTFISRGHNLCNDNAGGPLSTAPGGWLNAAGDRRITEPKLNALADNGGLTLTCALQSTSPAINAGDDALAPATDQRGLARSGISDIGAFEAQ